MGYSRKNPNPWIFHQIVLDIRSLLGNPSQSQNKDPWKFHIIFSVLLHFHTPLLLLMTHHEKTQLKALPQP